MFLDDFGLNHVIPPGSRRTTATTTIITAMRDNIFFVLLNDKAMIRFPKVNISYTINQAAVECNCFFVDLNSGCIECARNHPGPLTIFPHKKSSS